MIPILPRLSVFALMWFLSRFAWCGSQFDWWVFSLPSLTLSLILRSLLLFRFLYGLFLSLFVCLSAAWFPESRSPFFLFVLICKPFTFTYHSLEVTWFSCASLAPRIGACRKTGLSSVILCHSSLSHFSFDFTKFELTICSIPRFCVFLPLASFFEFSSSSSTASHRSCFRFQFESFFCIFFLFCHCSPFWFVCFINSEKTIEWLLLSEYLF